MQKKLDPDVLSVREITDVQLRPDAEDDFELIMAWRSHPQIYKHFYIQNSPLTWEEHINFWKSRKDRKDWLILFKENDKSRKVGTINVSNLSNNFPEIGVLIGEITLWNRGVAKKAVRIILDWLHNRGYKGGNAKVSVENVTSQRLFEDLAFKKQKAIRDGKEWLYQIKFHNEI